MRCFTGRFGVKAHFIDRRGARDDGRNRHGNSSAGTMYRAELNTGPLLLLGIIM